jgi:hypothetical protein
MTPTEPIATTASTPKAGLFATLGGLLHNQGTRAPSSRILLSTALVSLCALCFAATPALAKHERVYSAVFGGQVNKTKSQAREAAEKTAAEQAAAEQAANKAKVKAADERRAQEVAEAKITEAQAAEKAAEEKTAIESEEAANNKKRAEEVEEAAKKAGVTPAEEDVCTVASNDVCQPGKAGTGEGQFAFGEFGGKGGRGTAGVAVNDETGDIYVLDTLGRVQEFSEKGEYLMEFPISRGAGHAENIAVDNSCALHKPVPLVGLMCEAFDPSNGDVYVSNAPGNQSGGGPVVGVFKFTAAGTELEPITTGFEGRSFDGYAAEAVAVDSEGKVWVGQVGGHVDVYGDEEPNLLRRSIFEIPTKSSNFYFGGLAVDSEDDLYEFNGNGGSASQVAEINSSGQLLIEAVDPEKSTAVAVDPASDDVYVDNLGSIAEFGPAHACTAAQPCKEDPEPLERFGTGHLAESAGVAVSSSNETVYATNVTAADVDIFVKAFVPNVVEGEPSGLEHEGSVTLNGTVNPEGIEVTSCQFEYGPTSAYGTVEPCPAGVVGSSKSEELPVSVTVHGLTPDTLYHYRLVAGYAGQNEVNYGPDQTFVAGARPQIEHEKVEGTGSSEVTVSAQLAPGGLETTYDVQYGPCPEPYEQGTCAAAPYPSSTPEASAGAGLTATPVQVQLAGLQAGVVYHARLGASNAINHGESVFGGELVFTTASSTGPSSSILPDDRAYELVSPVSDVDVFVPYGMESGLTDVYGEHGIYTSRLSQAAAGGDAVIYNGDPPPAGGTGHFAFGEGDSYLATRASGGGWTAVDIQPPDIHSNYAAFSSDLSVGILGNTTAQLASEAPLEYNNLYSHALAQGAGGAFDPLITATPPDRTPGEFSLGGHGYGNGGHPVFGGANAGEGSVPPFSHLLFEANAALTPGAIAPSIEDEDLYDSVAGRLYLVNVLPEGRGVEPDAQFGGEDTEDTSHVISGNGSRIFWAAVEGPLDDRTPKALYVRVNDTRPQSPLEEGECVDPADACTFQVDASQVGGPGGGGRYLTASANGNQVFFTDERKLTEGSSAAANEPNLYEYDLEAPEGERLIDLSLVEHSGERADVQGMLGASVDGEYVYFVAHGLLASNANSQEVSAVAGADNLYLSHAGATTFIATLLGTDDAFGPVGFNPGGDWLDDPATRTADLTPDGHSLTFTSRAPLTGYDSRVAFPAESANLTEVFVYDADTNRLACASCDPGVAPVVPPPIREIAEVSKEGSSELWGSFLPTSLSEADYQPRVISDNGDRVFFNSFEPLVPAATNGWLDVYEWEREGTESTPGSGFSSCPVTTPARSSGGCIFLLSSPSSNENSYLLDADETGENVFFVTRAALVPADRGGDDDVLYDARVNGVQPPAKEACEGTACQGVPPAPPIFATPSSVTFNGIGNFPPPPSAPAKVKTAAEVRTEKLAKALKVCHKTKKKAKRVACEKQAKKKYGAKASKSSKSKRGGKS